MPKLNNERSVIFLPRRVFKWQVNLPQSMIDGQYNRFTVPLPKLATKIDTKIGATTLSNKERAKSYKSKYGYSVDAQNLKKVSKPFELEAIMAKTLRQYRVLGNTSGDSIEWFSLAEYQIWKMVLNIIGKCQVNIIKRQNRM